MVRFKDSFMVRISFFSTRETVGVRDYVTKFVDEMTSCHFGS